MKRAAVYARVSTAGQEKHGYSLEEQLQLLPKLATDKDFHLSEDDIFSETSSGAKDDRPEYNRMLARIVEGYYQAVFVIEKSRLGRTESREEEERVVKTLQSFGCIVVTPFSTYDVTTLEGEFIWDVTSAVDRNERKRIRYRMITGKHAKLKKGGYTGGNVPTGYIRKRSQETGKCVFEIDPESIQPVKYAFQRVLAGYSVASIAKDLCRQGYRTRTGNLIHTSMVDYWLKNPHYAGYTHSGCGRRKTTKPKVLIESNEFLEPIISQEDFQRVQELLQARSIKRHKTVRHPLSGILICPNCRMHMFKEQNHGKNVYVCASKKTLTPCSGEQAKYISYQEAHELVLSIIPRLVAYVDKNLTQIHTRIAKRQMADLPEDRLSRLEALKASLEKRIRLNIQEQEISASEFRRQRIIELEQEYNKANEELSDLRKNFNVISIPDIHGLDELCMVANPDDINFLNRIFPMLFKEVRFKRDGGSRSRRVKITSVKTAWGEVFNILDNKRLVYRDS